MRDKIINASIESLRQEGLKFSVDTLAARLKVSKKTIYRYFPDKETLALALYKEYYAQARKHAGVLTGIGTPAARSELLYLYLDAKIMTRTDIFNKYKLNKKIYSYTAEQNDALWEMVADALDSGVSEQEAEVLRIIVDGTFEKISNEQLEAGAIIERMVQLLW